MAVAGSATPAFQVWLRNGVLQERSSTALVSMCFAPDEAVALVALGDTVWVRGVQMAAFRQLWQERAKHD